MFLEYEDANDMTLEQVQSVLAHNRKNETTKVVVFGDNTPNGAIAVTEFDLILAFHFLVDALADAGCGMDFHLARKLSELGLSFSGDIMQRFVDFRRSVGVELDEDDEFQSTLNLQLYLRDKNESAI